MHVEGKVRMGFYLYRARVLAMLCHILDTIFV